MALHELRKDGSIEILGLLTTVTKDYDRISMHGVRWTLLERQTEALGLPLEVVSISKDASNEEYDNAMRIACEGFKKTGVSSIAFGDIFLEDVREYREKNLEQIGLTAIFPLWKKNTIMLSRNFLEFGFKAITTCVDSKLLGKEFVGREYDEKFLSDLPSGIDPCGENGEFHTFVYDGPVLEKKVRFKKGEIVLRDGRFWFCDLI